VLLVQLQDVLLAIMKLIVTHVDQDSFYQVPQAQQDVQNALINVPHVLIHQTIVKLVSIKITFNLLLHLLTTTHSLHPAIMIKSKALFVK
jgi:hypothetical protein